MPTHTWVPSLEILIYLAWGMTFNISKSCQEILTCSQEQALLVSGEAIEIPTLKLTCWVILGKFLNLSVPVSSFKK